MVRVMFVRFMIGGAPVGLVLVFAATRRNGTAVRLIGTNTEKKMSKLSIYMSKSEKSRGGAPTYGPEAEPRAANVSYIEVESCQPPRQQNDHFWTSRNWSAGRPLDVGCSSF